MRDRLAECARELGIRVQVQRLEASTRTVADAAVAVGCEEAEIAKSIVFVADGDPVVCVASGQHRVDIEKVADALDVAEVRQAGAEEVRAATGFAPATVMGQASRVMSRQRFFNVVITNVPGPQIPLYLAGKRMIDTFPMVPLAKNQALGVALLSYAGRINFGLVGDYDLLWDLDDFADDVHDSLAELAAEAGVELTVDANPVQAVRA